MNRSTSTPPFTQKSSLLKWALQTGQRLIAPHPTTIAVGDFHRAQLLAILTLVLSTLLILGLLFRPNSIDAFISFLVISLSSYAISRTKYFKTGIYLFTYAFTAFGFLRIYQGTASSIELSIVSTVHVSLVLSSFLLSPRGFLGLTLLATLATVTAPYYSHISIAAGASDNISLSTGIVFTTGMILFGGQLFRANLDKERHKRLTEINRELEDVKTSLEERIGIRTQELEKANQQVLERATRFQIVSEISQEIASNVDQAPRELLNLIARSISEKLGFYHVGIFLIDKNREFAVLRASNSQGGQRMMDRRHQLKVGGTGIVGYVSQAGRSRIALDTGTDAVFFNNPDLPKTRSEIALPLKYGARVIGVLDVQSTLPSAFKDEDANLLDTLANQIAVVIYNILIIEEQEMYPLSSRKQPGSGKRPVGQRIQTGYSHLPDGTIASAIDLRDAATEKALASGETVILVKPSRNTPPTLAIPVRFREQMIGIIHVQATEKNRKWTEDEVALVQAISDRAALALENARLFEETVRRAEQEETIAKITTQIGSSTDFKGILQTTIQELGQVLGASRSFIQLTALDDDENKRLT